MIGKEQMRAEPAAVLAFMAAAAGVTTTAPEGFDDNLANSWPVLCDPAAAMSGKAAFAVVTGVFAPFVRRHPDASAEALYREARERGVHKGDADGWRDLPEHVRFAFELFRDVLLLADRQQIGRTQAAVVGQTPRRATSAHESALEQVDGPLARETAAPKRAVRAAKPKAAPQKAGKSK